MRYPLDHPDPITVIIRDSMGMRRIRLDQPAHECYEYARATATHETWDALMRQKPRKAA